MSTKAAPPFCDVLYGKPQRLPRPTAPGGGEDEADAAGESNFFLFHNRFPFCPFFYTTKNRPRPKRSGPTPGIPSAVVLSREYRFGASCWRRNAQNAEYSKNRHCSYSVDGKQEGAIVGIRVRACESRPRTWSRCCRFLRLKKRVAHGLQLLSKGIWRHCTRRCGGCQRRNAFVFFDKEVLNF